MSDPGDILKSGPVDKVVDLLHRLAGPMFDEFGAMLADGVRVYRVHNLVSTVKKTERILCDAGLPANAVPPRLLLPIIENCSVEDDETLREMWAGLLATASQQTDSVSPSFIETLKQLTPDDARHFEHLVNKFIEAFQVSRLIPERHVRKRWLFEDDPPPGGVSLDTFERLGLIQRTIDPKTMIKGIVNVKDDNPEIEYMLAFTKYAVSFLEACHGPRPSPKT